MALTKAADIKPKLNNAQPRGTVLSESDASWIREQVGKLDVLANPPAPGSDAQMAFAAFFARKLSEVGRDRFASAVDRCAMSKHGDGENAYGRFYPQPAEFEAQIPYERSAGEFVACGQDGCHEGWRVVDGRAQRCGCWRKWRGVA